VSDGTAESSSASSPFDPAIVVERRVLERIAGLVFVVRRSMWLQKPVVLRSTPISTSMQKSHGRVRMKMFRERQMLARLLVRAAQQRLLVRRAEVRTSKT